MGRDTSRLTDEQRTFIVALFAQWKTPSQIRDALKEHFGVDASPQAIQHYDPEHSKDLSEKWRTLHASMREEFKASTSKIAIASSSFRLAVLSDGVQKALVASGGKLTPLVLQALEQAAKEVGGGYTNRRELTGADGKDLQPPAPPVIHVTIEGDPTGSA